MKGITNQPLISPFFGIYIRLFLRHTGFVLILKKQGSKGFSLIEVLASVLLLASLISVIVQLSYGNTRRIKKARQLEKVADLLELKMLEIEEEFKGGKIVGLSSEQEGRFENEENYFWAYETQPFVLPNPQMLLSLIQLPENELNMRMAKTLADVLSKTVVELKLTVRYEGKREKNFSYSLVSYFINYEDAPDFIFSQLAGLLPANTGL